MGTPLTLSTGSLVRPRPPRSLVGHAVRPLGPSTRYFARIVSANQFLLGLLMVIVPSQFAAPIYGPMRVHLMLYGTLFILSSTLLLVWQLLPQIDRSLAPQASLVFAAALFGLCLYAFASTAVWSGVVTYGMITAGLLASALDVERRTWFRGDIFIFVVASSVSGLGVLLLGGPGQFGSPAYVALRPHLAGWGVALLCSAALLVARLVLPSGRLGRCLAVMAALPILGWALLLSVPTHLWTGLITMGVLGVGAALRPFISSRWLAPPRSSLQNRLLVGLVLFVGGTLIVVMALVIRQTESAYLQQVRTDHVVRAALVANDVESFFTAQQHLTALTAMTPVMQSMDSDQQLPYLRALTTANPSTTLAAVSDQTGTTRLTSNGDRPNTNFIAQLPSLQRVVATHVQDWEVVLSPTLGIPVLAFRTPIIAADGAFVGVLSNLVSLTTLSAQLSALPVGQQGRVIVVDERGTVLIHPDPVRVSERANLSDMAPVAAALAGRVAPSNYVDPANRHWFTTQASVPGTGWTVLVEQPESEVLRPAERVREQMLVLLLLIMLLATPALVGLCRGFNRPVRALAVAVQKLEAGIYDAPLPSVADADLGQLIVAFDAMRVGRRRAEAQLEAQALHDSLTGLPNRVLLHDRLDQAIQTTNRYGDPASLLFLDLDGFKRVNDGFSHHIGDRLLIEISRRLVAALRASDTIARLGGDEFAVLLPKTDAAGALAVARTLRAAVIQPFAIDGHSLMVDVSIGIAVALQHGADAQALLQHADVAMYAAKATGGGGALYSADLAARHTGRLAAAGEPRTDSTPDAQAS